jgi:tetratricopeptide (TPR) repeat protein
LAATVEQVPEADRSTLLDRLATTELRLGQLDLARKHRRELALLERDNASVRIALFELAMMAGDRDDAGSLVEDVKRVEGPDGIMWKFLRSTLLIDEFRRGVAGDLVEARELALEIARRRPRWARGFALSGELAEVSGSPDEAIARYLRAIELGGIQPSLVRKLVSLLTEAKRFDDVDRVEKLLRDQGTALDELKIVRAWDAIRTQRFDEAIRLARQVFSPTSTEFSDHLNLGRLYLAAGSSEAAGKEFKRAVELGRRVAESWLAYVAYLARTKQLDRAKAAIEDARVALTPDRATLTLAQCCSLVGDAKQAENLIVKAMSQEGRSEDPTALRTAATVFLTQNRPDKVAETLAKFDRAPDLSAGDRAWSNRVRATVLLANRRPADGDHALTLIQQNLGHDPDNTEDRQLKAVILARQPGRRGEAIGLLEKMSATHQLDANGRFLLAQLYLRQGDDAKYVDQMERLLRLTSGDTQHLTHFIRYFIDKNQLEKADRWLTKLKRDDPHGLPAVELEAQLLDLRQRKPELKSLIERSRLQFPDQIGSIADLFNRYGFTAEAEAAYKASIAREPTQPERALALAQFLASKDRVDEAMTVLNRARSTCRPDRVAVSALLVYNAASASPAQKVQIKAWLEEAVRRHPEDDLLEANLGTLFYKEGQFVEAAELYGRVLKRNPYQMESLANLAWLLALRDPGDPQKALELINRAIDAYGSLLPLVDARAVVLARKKEFDQALRDLRLVKQGDPVNPRYSLHLAWALQLAGQSAEARKEFQVADRLGLDAAIRDPLFRDHVVALRQAMASN